MYMWVFISAQNLWVFMNKRKELKHQLPTLYPAIKAMMPKEMLATVQAIAQANCPPRARSRFSFIKVEKVVKPPQNPVIRSSLVAGEILLLSAIAESKPIRKLPTTLTANVAKGNWVFIKKAMPLPERQRMPPPKKLPIHTNNNSFIVESGIK